MSSYRMPKRKPITSASGSTAPSAPRTNNRRGLARVARGAASASAATACVNTVAIRASARATRHDRGLHSHDLERIAREILWQQGLNHIPGPHLSRFHDNSHDPGFPYQLAAVVPPEHCRK